MTRLGIVTGLAAEARCLSRHYSTHIDILAARGDPAAAAETLAAQGAKSLMSFGIAGGLDPALAPGALVVATTIIDNDVARDGAWDGNSYDCDAAWRDRLAGVFSARTAPVVGSDGIIATVAGKRALHARHGAAAVDMESHAVARVAARAGLPFAAIRAIADPAGRALPSAALAGLSERGETQLTPVLLELARHPRQLPDVVRVALDTRKALAALGRCAAADGLLLLLGGG